MGVGWGVLGIIIIHGVVIEKEILGERLGERRGRWGKAFQAERTAEQSSRGWGTVLRGAVRGPVLLQL